MVLDTGTGNIPETSLVEPSALLRRKQVIVHILIRMSMEITH